MNIGLTLLIEILTFVLFIYFFAKVFWNPLMKLMEDRKTRISDGLAAAERGTRELNEATAKAEDMLKQAREQAKEVLSNAQRQSNENIEASREEARAEGERMIESARDEIDQSVTRAKEDLRREVGTLAIDGAERILKREIDKKAHNDIIDELVAGIK